MLFCGTFVASDTIQTSMLAGLQYDVITTKTDSDLCSLFRDQIWYDQLCMSGHYTQGHMQHHWSKKLLDTALRLSAQEVWQSGTRLIKLITRSCPLCNGQSLSPVFYLL